MKKKYWLLTACLLLTGCGASSAVDETTEPAASIPVITKEETEAVTEHPQETTENVTEITTVEEPTTLAPATTTEEATAEADTTPETSVKETEETTKETEKTTETEARVPKSITAEIGGHHTVGDTLAASDFSVTITYSDGSQEVNPNGWGAEPLTLSGTDTMVEVFYLVDGMTAPLKTQVTVKAEPAPVTEAPTNPPVLTPVGDEVVNVSTTLYTYAQMEADLATLASRYPDRLAIDTAGTTADGRAIYRAYFGNRNASRQIFIGAATHAREYMTAQLVMKQLEFYCRYYDSGTYNGRTFKDIFDQTCFVVIPMINPDGVSISQLGEAGLRNEGLRAQLRTIYANDVNSGFTADSYDRYLVRWKANGRGVDLNRNFSPGWESVMDRVAPSSTTFKGTAPGSEAETQALMNTLSGLSNPLMAISYHSYGDLVYWQYGQPEPLWSANQRLAALISGATGHYLAGYSNEAGFSNWAVRERGIPSVTVETGRVPAPLPLDQFALLWAQHQYTWTLLATNY